MKSFNIIKDLLAIIICIMILILVKKYIDFESSILVGLTMLMSSIESLKRK